MSFYTRYKNIILGIVLLLVAFIGYSYFFTGTPAPALSSSSPSQNAAVDQDLISLLLTLKNIKLDGTIFTDPTFQSLDDFSQQLVVEPAGRTNPFAPLGSSKTK